MSPEKTNESNAFKKVFSTDSKDALLKFYKDNFQVLVCAKLIAIGLLLRFWVISSPLGNIDEKQALVLLQAKDFSEGQFSIMREGRFTGGSLEVLLNVPFVAIFGATRTAAWIVPLLLLIATSYVLWRAFVNTPYKNVMRLVMACLWISPAYFVITSSRATGHVSLEIFLYTCIFASAYYAAHSLRNLRYFYLWAFLSGLAVWTNPASIALAIICLVWIFWSAPAMKKHKTRALAYFVLGSSFLWVHVLEGITSNGKLSLFRQGIDAKSEFTRNSLFDLEQVIGSLPYTSGKFEGPSSNPLIFTISLLIWGLAWFSISQANSKDRTGFKQLQIYIYGFFLCSAAIPYLLRLNSFLPELLIPVIIPMLFLLMSAHKSRIVISTALIFLFIVSITSIDSSITIAQKSSTSATTQITKVLRSEKISRAISSHELGYPVTVKSGDEIFVTPFDGNDFNKRRSDVVHKSVEAIVVDTNVKGQIDLAFCVQGTFKTTFEAIRSDSFDILIVDKNLRGKIWNVVEKCNAR